MRKALFILAAVAGTVSGCAQGLEAADAGQANLQRPTAAAPIATSRPGPSVSCTAVRAARISGPEAPYSDGLQLSHGWWQSGDDTVRTQKPCAIGRLKTSRQPRPSPR